MTAWSSQQQDIFSWFGGGSGNLVVRARAGTGKTTSILEALNHAPEEEILLCAFNRRIADELTRRLTNPNAVAKTLHGAGLSAIRRQWRGTQVDEGRGDLLAARVCGPQAPDEMVILVKRLASFGKGILPFGTPEELGDLAEEFDCTPDKDWAADGWTLERVSNLARAAMDAALERDGTVDFDDMLWVAVGNKFARPMYDLVVVDEAQDMNNVQLMLAQRMCRQGGRIVIVGDDCQAIYSFRGADSTSIDRLKVELSATELPLTITYRCPQKVVALAKRLVPDFCAAPDAPMGTVERCSTDSLLESVQAGDAVLSRLNAPIVSLCLKFIAHGRRARMEGRDIGKNIKVLVEKIAGKRHRTVPSFIARVEQWRGNELLKAQGLKEHAAAHRSVRVNDQADTLLALAEGCQGSVDELLALIDDLFDDTRPGQIPAIVCSSIHRAKGLEWLKVYLLEDTLYIYGHRVNQEEKNVEYVGVTRTKDTLILATAQLNPKKKEERP